MATDACTLSRSLEESQDDLRPGAAPGTRAAGACGRSVGGPCTDKADARAPGPSSCDRSGRKAQ